MGANFVDPDQTPRSAASDLDQAILLQFLPIFDDVKSIDNNLTLSMLDIYFNRRQLQYFFYIYIFSTKIDLTLMKKSPYGQFE